MPAKRKPSTAVAVHHKAAPVSDQQAFLAMIERAARDPSVDVQKLKELLAIRDREQDRTAASAFAIAMMEAQREMEPVRKDCSNSQTKSKYASYLALDRAIRPVYSRHGFALTFNTEPMTASDMQRDVCKVMHKDGHIETYTFDIPIVTKGPQGKDVMTATHAAMSANTYGKRGLLKMIFNIVETGEDDDGNAASGSPIVSQEQTDIIKTAIADAKLPMDKFEMAFGPLDRLPASRMQEALDRVHQFKQRGFQKNG